MIQENYSLIDGSKDIWKLGKVTPRREKILSEIGLIRDKFDSSQDDNVDAVLKKMLDGLNDNLLKLLNILFEGREIKKEELENLDKTEVKVAVFSFFLRDLKLLEEFGNLIPISCLLK